MTYQQTLDYLYNVAPMFQSIGAGAYKEGLSNTHTLDEHFGHPHTYYRTIHVAGTNGKGSVSHTLAAVLQSAGLKVGLYTSPHLLDFRERIRVNGEMIPEQRVVDFVEKERSFFEPLYPSFFELTTALAFLYFKEQQVDVAVVEVGLGGRLDCTNIIRPDLAIITNISFDHTQFLGDTLPQIAREKAGIIKQDVPVIIGQTGLGDAETEEQRAVASEVREVFLSTARSHKAEIRFADEEPWIAGSEFNPDGTQTYALVGGGRLQGELGGIYQRHNTATLLCAVDALLQQPYYAAVMEAHPAALREGLMNVVQLTGLQGRWQCLRQAPLTICDAGHNVAGIAAVTEQLMLMPQTTIHIIIGMVNDKDVRGAVRQFGKLLQSDKTVSFHLTQPSCKRALPVEELQAIVTAELGIDPSALPCSPVASRAYESTIAASKPSDLVIIMGSCYLAADMLEHLSSKE